MSPGLSPASVGSATDRGITIGIMIAIVPHEVPVAKEMNAQIRKTSTGSMRGSRFPVRSPTT